jgi:hypothetical protein
LRSTLPLLLALTTAVHAADGPKARDAEPKKLSATSLLPDGSELKGVMIPRHDENHHLVGSLKADVITLVNDTMIAGKQVFIDFYNLDGSSRGHIELPKATFNQQKGLLQSNDNVTIHSQQFQARGSGVHYAIQKGDGFLTGPGTTWIESPKTTMNSSRSLIGAAGIALIAQTTAAPTTTTPDAAKLDPVLVQGVKQSAHSEVMSDTHEALKKDLEKSAEATKQTKEFLDQTDITPEEVGANAVPSPDGKPMDIQIGPNDTMVSFDGGMYFDVDKGLLVYLKNVKVNDPRFALDGANELKIFLAKDTTDKKPADKKPTDKKPADNKTADKKPESGSGASLEKKFDKVERIVATGAVHILQKSTEKGKAPIEASGAIFTYHPITGEIIISGGYPWVKQGSNFMRARQPNLTLRIQKSGSFHTEGQWDMGGSNPAK